MNYGRKSRFVGVRVLASLALALGGSHAYANAREFVPGEIIVKVRGKAKTLKAQAFIGKAVAEKSMTLKGSWAGLNMHHFKVKDGDDLNARLAELNSDPDVEYAEPNYIVRMQSTGPEGEKVEMSAVQAAATASSTYSMTNAPIGLSQGWSASTPHLDPVTVAVIDTGLALTHSVFTGSGAIWTNPGEIAGNGIDDDGNGYIDDVNGWNFVANTNSPYDDDGHGTHVSGIVLGTTQDITAVPIEAAKIRIMPLKFLDASGAGTTSDAVKAIYYAVNNGAKVLNNSWGGGGFSNSLLEAMAWAYNKKVAFVSAAGNASANNDVAPTYPGNYNVPNNISVAATTDSDGFASFSNYGASTVYMGSPGMSIWSTFPPNQYGRSSGTSMATPFISGVAALMMRERPEMTGYQVKELLEANGNKITSLSTRTSSKTRLNVANTVNAAKAASVSVDQPNYDASASRAPASSGASQAGMAGGCGLVGKVASDMMNGDGGGLSGPGKNVAFFGLLVVLISPVLLSLALRSRDGRNKRRYTRYEFNSQVKVKFGDRELVGQVSTISLGGVQLNTDAWLEKGGLVTMQIRSPDGSDEINVEGKIVWSEEQKRYGVAFSNADEPVLSQITKWTRGLIRV